MDTMETPIVNELSRMSAHPGADLPSVKASRTPDLETGGAHPAEGERIAEPRGAARAGS